MKSNKNKKLVVIVGPTAVGKTALCVRLAELFQCEIVSCDSRQFYKELAIGTAKPTATEMKEVKHNFINSHSILDYYSAGDYERDVELFLENYFKEKDIVIVTGGSGLFVKALLEGLDDMPNVSLEIRNKLMLELEKDGLESLQKRLEKLDFETYQKIDIFNSQRVVRALEVCEATGQKYSDFKSNKSKKLPYQIVKIGLELDREILYNRINRRVDEMFKIGLIEEVKSLEEFRKHNALQTVGYKEVFDYLDGKSDLVTMTETLKRNTRRYAKRQMTWFKNQDNFTWFNPNDFERIVEFIEA